MDFEVLKRMLIRDEGLKDRWYPDTEGIPTIGIGHNLNVPISEKAIYQIFVDDVNTAVTELDANLPWWRSLNEPRQHVMINMAFNLGITRLLAFKHTLALIRDGHYPEAAEAMLDSKWALQVKGRALRLAEMMRTGASAV
jgi:lysozyme